MGFNTTVVVLNDALNEIQKDPDFGRKLAEAIMMSGRMGRHFRDVSAGCHCNAATVVETHHADQLVMVAVGGNCGQELGYCGSYAAEPEDMLRALADSMGFRIVKKPKKPRSIPYKGGVVTF